MKRTFLIPFVSALLGGGVVAAVVAAAGGLESGKTPCTTVHDLRPLPAAPSNASQRTHGPHAARSLRPRRARRGVRHLDGRAEIANRRSTCSAAKRQRQGQATGSGIVIDANGTILTNYHVVENAIKVTVSFEKGKTVEAQVVGKDPSNDLAVLRIPTDGADAAPARARRLQRRAGRRPGVRDRQPVRPRTHAHDRRDLGAAARDHGAQRLRDQQRAADRRADQPRQLGRTAAQRARAR